MYRFQVSAVTQPGETVALAGSVPEMGLWDMEQRVLLQTSEDRYPIWWVDLDLKDTTFGKPDNRRIEYKYLFLGRDGKAAWESQAWNRWIPVASEPWPSPVIVDDGWIGQIQPYPYGYFAEPVDRPLPRKKRNGLKIVVIGSSVAMGCSAWLLEGWAWQLTQTLNQQGHQVVNVSELGANVGSTIARFPHMVAPQKPDIVIIALSLGNEGLASCGPMQERPIQRRFENGLQQLVRMTRELGALPILGGVYPHGSYSPSQYAVLQETHQRMLTWGVPVLDWLSALDDGQGRWQPGISFDPAHPNMRGHQLMYEAIDLDLFQRGKADFGKGQMRSEALIYQDDRGFRVLTCPKDNGLRIVNKTPHSYTLNPDWTELQMSLQDAHPPAGLYMAEAKGGMQSLFVQDDGTIETVLTVPPHQDLTFYPAFHFFAPHQAKVLFYDGHLGILKINDRRLYIVNDSDHAYNVQPMWQEVRDALKAMPAGIYEDPVNPDAPFRTLMVGKDGLESRVKVAAKSAMALEYQCSLAERKRIAILPLGDRCGVRMLLYKLEYDGPAFPFDLTRTTNVADVADMIHGGFQDMWNPAFLHYNPDEKRIYHFKWAGLSFAHEVEDYEDPINNMAPIYDRMRRRYSARGQRFLYALDHCDEVLFVRTGGCDRGAVLDLVEKLEAKCKGKPFRVLIISPQSSEEFAGIPQVVHRDLMFNPDQMYAELDHWIYCTGIMGEILHSLGISSKNLFWCPPNPPKE